MGVGLLRSDSCVASIVAFEGGGILVFAHAFTMLGAHHRQAYPFSTRPFPKAASLRTATKDSFMARPTRGEDHPRATASESVDG